MSNVVVDRSPMEAAQLVRSSSTTETGAAPGTGPGVPIIRSAAIRLITPVAANAQAGPLAFKTTPTTTGPPIPPRAVIHWVTALAAVNSSSDVTNVGRSVAVAGRVTVKQRLTTQAIAATTQKDAPDLMATAAHPIAAAWKKNPTRSTRPGRSRSM